MWLDRILTFQDKKPAEVPSTPAPYQPRSTRFRLDAPVSFESDGRTYKGQCVNVSESGLLARFHEPPEPWTDGQLMFEAGELYFGIPVRVARVQREDVGFAFSLSTEKEREAVRLLVNSLSDRPLETEPSE